MTQILKIFLFFILAWLFKTLIDKKVAKDLRKRFLEKENISGRSLFFWIKSNRIKCAICSITIFILAIINGSSFIKSLICGIIVYLMLYISEIIRKNSEKKQVLQDLLNIAECLRVQISSGMSLDIALRNIPDLCKNKEFSVKLTDLYLEYSLSKFTVGESARVLQNRFNYSEMKIFISALNQQSQGTSALEAFDNLIEVLKEKYIDYMEENTKTKSAIMIVGICIIVFNLAAMSIYPLIIETTEALKVMLM